MIKTNFEKNRVFCIEIVIIHTKKVYITYCSMNMGYYDARSGRFTQQDDWAYMKPEDPLSLNLYVYCQNNPVLLVDPSGNDAIIITNKDSVNLGVLGTQGHTSAIYQDANGNWFYTYWGLHAAAVIPVPTNVLGSLPDFDKWLQTYLSDNNLSNITYAYTNATYVYGDFTASLSAAYDDVNNAFTKSLGGYLKSDSSNLLAFQGVNKAYSLMNYNCLHETVATLKKGILANGTSAAAYMFYNDYTGGVIPNRSISWFEKLFLNSSFTSDGAYSEIKSFLKSSDSWWHFFDKSEYNYPVNRVNYANSVYLLYNKGNQ